MAEKIFATGAFLKIPDNKPDFVIGRLGIKVDEFKAFLDEHVKNNGWVDLDLLMGRENKPYVALNTFTPERPAVAEDGGTSSVPF